MMLTRRICLSRASAVGEYLSYPHNLNLLFTSDITGENLMLVTTGGQIVKCVPLVLSFLPA